MVQSSMETKEAPQYFEAGVYYSWLTHPTIEPVARGMMPHTFTRRHNPSGTTSTLTVYLWPECRHTPSLDLLRLMNHWNRTPEWSYWA